MLAQAEPIGPGGAAARADRRHSASRRHSPRPIDTDWLVLKGLREGIRKLVPAVARPGMKALDLGCGTRPYEAMFSGLQVEYVGADFDGAELLIDQAGRVHAPDGSADLVLSFQVLEHVRSLAVYLSEARRVLRREGHLLLSTHGTWLYHPHPEDHRRWTREGLTAELAEQGFEVQRCIPIVGPLAWTTMVRLTCACFALRRVPWIGHALAGALSLAMNVRALLEDAITPVWVTRDNACVYLVLCCRSR